MTRMHGDGVHDPGHDLRVGTHVRRRDVLFRTDEDRYLGGVAAGYVGQAAFREPAGGGRGRPPGSPPPPAPPPPPSPPPPSPTPPPRAGYRRWGGRVLPAED